MGRRTPATVENAVVPPKPAGCPRGGARVPVLVILSEDAQTFAHTHGEQVGSPSGQMHHGGAVMTGGYGPEIAFEYPFPRPGLYKLWGQFQTHDGQVITADFVVRAQ